MLHGGALFRHPFRDPDAVEVPIEETAIPDQGAAVSRQSDDATPKAVPAGNLLEESTEREKASGFVAVDAAEAEEGRSFGRADAPE